MDFFQQACKSAGQFCRPIRAIARRFSGDELGLYAAQAAFFITLSAVPLLIVSLSLVRFVVPISFDELLQGICDLTPTGLRDLVAHLVSDAYQKSSATVLSLSSLTALWSASRCVYALRLGLNNIHRIEKRRGYLYNRISALFYTVGILLVLLFSLVVLIFGNKLQFILSQHFPLVADLVDTFLGVRSLPAIAILLIFFLSVYTLLPDAPASARSQLPGAMFCTSGWLFLSLGFSLYVDHFTGRSMYGSLTAVVLAMLWLYLCMYLVLIGAELNVWMRDYS